MNEQELTNMLERLNDKELSRFADSLRRLASLIGRRELQKILVKKIAKFEKRLARIEQWQQQPATVRKNIEGQDDENADDKWPSLGGLIL